MNIVPGFRGNSSLLCCRPVLYNGQVPWWMSFHRTKQVCIAIKRWITSEVWNYIHFIMYQYRNIELNCWTVTYTFSKNMVFEKPKRPAKMANMLCKDCCRNKIILWGRAMLFARQMASSYIWPLGNLCRVMSNGFFPFRLWLLVMPNPDKRQELLHFIWRFSLLFGVFEKLPFAKKVFNTLGFS